MKNLKTNTALFGSIKAKDANGLHLQDDGGNGMFIEDGGNVGIGTTNPVTSLHVTSPLGNGDGTVFIENTLADWGMGLKVKGGGNVDNERFALRVQNAAGDDILFAQSKTGNVGVGTTNPGSLLHIAPKNNEDANGDPTNESYFKVLDNSTSGSAQGRNGGVVIIDANYYTSSSDIFLVKSRGENKLTIKGSGDVGIGATSPVGKLHVTDLSVSIGNVTVTNTGTGVTGGTSLDTKISNGDRIKINGEIFTVSSVSETTLTLNGTPSTAGTFTAYTDSNGLVVTSAGNVGIGTTSPIRKLHVADSHIRVNNDYGLESDGGNSRVLVGNAIISLQTSNNEAVRINSSGNVGIGTTSPNARLEVKDADNDLQMRIGSISSGISPVIRLQGKNNANTTSKYADIKLDAENGVLTLLAPNDSTPTINAINVKQGGNVGIGTTNPNVKLDVIGSIEYTGTITDVSDQRKKENVQDLENSLSKICQLNGKSYEMIDDNEGEEGTELGFIAQEVQQIFPEIVKVVERQESEDGETQEYLGVSYIQLIAPLVESIKEQQQLIDDLKSQNESLAARISALES